MFTFHVLIGRIPNFVVQFLYLIFLFFAFFKYLRKNEKLFGPHVLILFVSWI